MKDKSILSLIKMKEYAIKAIEYIKGFDFDQFITDSRTIEACVFNISQVGELVQHLDPSIITKYNKVNWQGIKGLRNRIVHDYKGIKIQMIWIVLSENLPKIVIDIDSILNDLEKPNK
jgi:uncharacterized protein with HEPN domain